MNVKSLIARPSRGETLEQGPQELRGVAWTGQGVITRVQVRIDDRDWEDAEMDTPAREGTWRVWHYGWTAHSGTHSVRVRATDSSGQTQPEIPPWNKSGYLWNGIEQVDVEVKAHA